MTFPFTKVARKKPEEIGQVVGEYLVNKAPEAVGYNTVKGFLNLELADGAWGDMLNEIIGHEQFGTHTATIVAKTECVPAPRNPLRTKPSTALLTFLQPVKHSPDKAADPFDKRQYNPLLQKIIISQWHCLIP